MTQGDRARNYRVEVGPSKPETQQEEARPAKVAVPLPELEDTELEEVMMKMQITMETEMKRDRLEKVEMRRKEDEESSSRGYEIGSKRIKKTGCSPEDTSS